MAEDRTGAGVGQASRSATSSEAGHFVLGLPSPERWQRLGRPGEWRVSPRFAGGGSLLLLSGRAGQGLFLVDPRGQTHTVDAFYKGPAHLKSDGRTLCLPHRDSSEGLGALPLGLRLGTKAACATAPHDPELGRVVHTGPRGRFIHHPMRGDLVHERPGGGGVVVVDDRVPWSIRVSPEGRYVAYAVGSLPSPTLFLWEVGGSRRALGCGTHPVFHPDGVLVFSRPDGTRTLGSLTTVARAELRAYDLETGASWALTDTPEVAEMQPAVSPDGKRLAFSDWRGGGAYLVTIRARRNP